MRKAASGASRTHGVAFKKNQASTDPYLPRGAQGKAAVRESCRAEYRNKRWYRAGSMDAAALAGAVAVVCPACLKMRDDFPGGIVTLKGDYVLAHKKDILKLAKNEEERARGYNPLERIMSIKENGHGGLVISTTNEKLAQRLGRSLNPSGKKHRFGKAWMHEHVTDHWVQEAKRRGYRSRAAFKLLEIGKKDRLFRPGIRAVDLGAAPGSWSQVLAEKLGPKATIVAIDLLPMEPVRGVAAIVGDFSSDEGLAAVEAALGGAKVDLVVSDMAPNLSGIDAVDQARSMHLAELALDFVERRLQPGGDFAVKASQGGGFDAFQRQVATRFDKAYVRKPEASRDRSREVFVVGKRRRGGGGAE